MLTIVRRAGFIAASTLLIAGFGLFAACEKNAEEAEKFPSTESPVQMAPGELTTFRLANGITVYLQEERSRPEIAVEVLYRAGVFDEPEGKIQISRLLPHMLIFSPTASFEANQVVEDFKKIGQINGEITGQLTHFDYIVSTGNLGKALDVEAERLTSVRFEQELLEVYARKCGDDLNTMMTSPGLSLTKYGLMAFNQAFYYGKTSIPIEKGIYYVTLNDLERFHRNHYRLDEMVLVVIGDIDTEEATQLIRQKLEHITLDPADPPRQMPPAEADVNAQWDISAQVILLTFPGPYADERTRLALTLFGTYLNRELSIDDDLQFNVRSTYCSSHVYPVGEIPFFIFAEVRKGRNLQDIRSALIFAVDATMQKVSEGVFNAMKANMITFCESSMLTSSIQSGSGVSHFQIIGQEALNIGLRHYLRDGRTAEEFVELVRSLTYEEAREIVSRTLTLDRMKTVTVSGTE
jgi:predicted Zn-dependent peptidase